MSGKSPSAFPRVFGDSCDSSEFFAEKDDELISFSVIFCSEYDGSSQQWLTWLGHACCVCLFCDFSRIEKARSWRAMLLKNGTPASSSEKAHHACAPIEFLRWEHLLRSCAWTLSQRSQRVRRRSFCFFGESLEDDYIIFMRRVNKTQGGGKFYR